MEVVLFVTVVLGVVVTEVVVVAAAAALVVVVVVVVMAVASTLRFCPNRLDAVAVSLLPPLRYELGRYDESAEEPPVKADDEVLLYEEVLPIEGYADVRGRYDPV